MKPFNRSLRSTWLRACASRSGSCTTSTSLEVEEHDPPPNPTKITDSRAEAYIERHGYECWEVDALDPATLQQVIEDAFSTVLDDALMEGVKEREEEDKMRLREAVQELMNDNE